MKLTHGLHLAYCTNVHRGETWTETLGTLERHTLEVRRRVLGEEHPDTLQSMVNLAVLHHYQGQDSKAEPLLVNALEVSRRVLGEEHPNPARGIRVQHDEKSISARLRVRAGPHTPAEGLPVREPDLHRWRQRGRPRERDGSRSSRRDECQQHGHQHRTSQGWY